MYRFFYTSILPEHLIKKNGLSVAACNFSFNLMSGGAFDKVYSVLWSNHNGKVEKEAFEDSRYELICSKKLRSLGRIGRLLGVIKEQWIVFRNIPEESSVWFYNLDILSVFLYIFLRLFRKSVLINIIVLDFTPTFRPISLRALYLRLINNADGNIRLSNSDLFTCKNASILPGVVPKGAGNEPLIFTLNNKFLLSGVLFEQISQISMVLEAFSRLPKCELHITGKTDNETLILDYTEHFSNIIWHGNVSFQEYLDIMHSCTFQLSTRDSRFPENQCNFPSKIIETLLHNRVIISTICYPQLDGINYYQVSSQLDTFVMQIENISKQEKQKLLIYANQGQKVAEFYSTNVWNNTMEKIEVQKI